MFRTKTRRGEELSAIKAHFDPSASDAPERFLWNQEADGNTIIPDAPERFRCGIGTEMMCPLPARYSLFWPGERSSGLTSKFVLLNVARVSLGGILSVLGRTRIQSGV
ncbi:unnamed protein product, partial [Clonostachys rosea f. rosea IK726]